MVPSSPTPQSAEQLRALSISSPAFADGGAIPQRYTCEGGDAFPPLAIHGVPRGAKSLALIVDDPDAPRKTWVHAVLVGIPPQTTELSAPPPGARFGVNDWGEHAWGAPCPPSGEHRYVFKLYALDTDVHALRAPTKEQLERAMEGHVLASAQLVGRYVKY